MSRATALRRLMTEYKQLTTNGAPDNMFTAGPISEEDFFTWEAVIEGPKDTPFEGGVFVAKLEFVSPYYYRRATPYSGYYPIGLSDKAFPILQSLQTTHYHLSR